MVFVGTVMSILGIALRLLPIGLIVAVIYLATR